jgi:hypothetical protein
LLQEWRTIARFSQAFAWLIFRLIRERNLLFRSFPFRSCCQPDQGRLTFPDAVIVEMRG